MVKKLSDKELRDRCPEPYRLGRVDCKKTTHYFNPYPKKSNDRKAYALGWGECCDERHKEINRETTNL